MGDGWNQFGVPADGRSHWQIYLSTILRGDPVVSPRLDAMVPVRLPHPGAATDAEDYGSIYVQQDRAIRSKGADAPLSGRFA